MILNDFQKIICYNYETIKSLLTMLLANKYRIFLESTNVDCSGRRTNVDCSGSLRWKFY